MIKNRTKVLVHSKNYGCPIKDVFARQGDGYPTETPFFAWTRRMHKMHMGEEIYTLTYMKSGNGGDYYRRSDFELINEDMFSNEDFLL